MIFPGLILLASIGSSRPWHCHVTYSEIHVAMGIAFDIETASPNGLFGSTTASFAIPYFAISLSLNIILTVMIAGRIWYYQRSVATAIGGEFAIHYTSITTMFVESAAIYSVTSLLLLITFTMGNPINQIWLGIAPSVQVICLIYACSHLQTLMCTFTL